MNKSIEKCSFDVKVDNGATNASFQGYPKEVQVYSGGYEFRPYYYGGQATDQALSGKLRSFLGGYRFEGRLNWERLLNTQNLSDVVNKSVVGTEKLFWSTTVDDNYTAKTNIGLDEATVASAYFQGMAIDFNGADRRIITNYNQSNLQVTLNSAVDAVSGATANIYALANMTPKTYIYPDSSNTRNEEIVITDTAWSMSLESTVIRQPLSVEFRGTNVETSIPSYYDL